MWLLGRSITSRSLKVTRRQHIWLLWPLLIQVWPHQLLNAWHIPKFLIPIMLLRMILRLHLTRFWLHQLLPTRPNLKILIPNMLLWMILGPYLTQAYLQKQWWLLCISLFRRDCTIGLLEDRVPRTWRIGPNTLIHFIYFVIFDISYKLFFFKCCSKLFNSNIGHAINVFKY